MLFLSDLNTLSFEGPAAMLALLCQRDAVSVASDFSPNCFSKAVHVPDIRSGISVNIQTSSAIHPLAPENGKYCGSRFRSFLPMP